MINKLKKSLPLLMIVVMMFCAGCDDQFKDNNIKNNPKTNVTNETEENNKDTNLPPKTIKPESNNTKINESENKKSMKVKVYYPDESGLHLVGVKRDIEVDNKVDKFTAAVEAVMTPPTEKNLTSVISNHSSLINVKVKDGIATVNLNKNVKKGFIGGSTGEEFLIGSVVNTLTEFEEVNAVKFLIDGQQVETLSGHMDLSEPIKRMNNLLKK